MANNSNEQAVDSSSLAKGEEVSTPSNPASAQRQEEEQHEDQDDSTKRKRSCSSSLETKRGNSNKDDTDGNSQRNKSIDNTSTKRPRSGTSPTTAANNNTSKSTTMTTRSSTAASTGGGQSRERISTRQSTAAAAAAESSSNTNENNNTSSSTSLVQFPIGPINSLLTCSLCGGYFRHPTKIVECLHTFCESCLTYAFLAGITQCPTCQVHLGPDPLSKTQRDRPLETLLDRVLFPHLKEYDTVLERAFYREQGIALKEEYRDQEESDEEEGQRDDDAAAEQKEGDETDDDDDQEMEQEDRTDSEDQDATSGSMTTRRRRQQQQQEANNQDGGNNNAMAMSQHVDHDEVEFTMTPSYNVPHRMRLPQLDMELIRTSGRVKIGTLKKYIWNKLQQQNGDILSELMGHRRREYEALALLEMYCGTMELGNEQNLTFIDRTMKQHDHGRRGASSSHSGESSFPISNDRMDLNYCLSRHHCQHLSHP